MKAFKATYKHGHFIDLETGKRLIPVQNAEYTISASDNAFGSEDSKLKIPNTKNKEEKAAWAEREFGSKKYSKIMDAGSQLFFRIGNSRKAEGDESKQYIFLCTLLEDLFLYQLKFRDGNKEEDWRLADCKCHLEKCLKGGLTLSEKVPAESLNSLFSHTVMFYFPLQRSGSANAFKTFFTYKEGMEVDFESAIYEQYDGLQNSRKRFLSNRLNTN